MRPSSFGNRSGGQARRLIVRGSMVAAVVGVAMLGNLRLQASEAAPRATFDEKKVVAVQPSIVPKVESGFARRQVDDVGEEVHLVPAIYAWDPDVRFVYFRHVSKWM